MIFPISSFLPVRSVLRSSSSCIRTFFAEVVSRSASFRMAAILFLSSSLLSSDMVKPTLSGPTFQLTRARSLPEPPKVVSSDCQQFPTLGCEEQERRLKFVFSSRGKKWRYDTKRAREAKLAMPAFIDFQSTIVCPMEKQLKLKTTTLNGRSADDEPIR